MHALTGELYDSVADAREAGVPDRDLVEITGTPEAVAQVSQAVSAQFAKAVKRRRAAGKVAKASRKRNRGQS